MTLCVCLEHNLENILIENFQLSTWLKLEISPFLPITMNDKPVQDKKEVKSGHAVENFFQPS